MGQQTLCKARLDGKTSEGKALLETDYVLFRGNARIKIPFRAITKLEANGAWLEIESTEGALALHLGPAAPKWKEKILHPPSRLTKLGVKQGMLISVSGVKDDQLKDEIQQAGATLKTRVTPNSDIIFYAAEQKPALDRLEALSASIQPNGAIWVIYPKGVKHITEGDVLRAIRAASLTDVKVASFSPTHTALKAVIPSARRPVAAQHAKKNSQLAQMPQRIANRGFLAMTQQIHVKHVLPRLPAPRPRFDFRQVQIPQRQRAQRPEE